MIESGGEVDWAGLAVELGFADQSHFTNAFTGWSAYRRVSTAVGRRGTSPDDLRGGRTGALLVRRPGRERRRAVGQVGHTHPGHPDAAGRPAAAGRHRARDVRGSDQRRPLDPVRRAHLADPGRRRRGPCPTGSRAGRDCRPGHGRARSRRRQGPVRRRARVRQRLRRGRLCGRRRAALPAGVAGGGRGPGPGRAVLRLGLDVPVPGLRDLAGQGHRPLPRPVRPADGETGPGRRHPVRPGDPLPGRAGHRRPVAGRGACSRSTGTATHRWDRAPASTASPPRT